MNNLKMELGKRHFAWSNPWKYSGIVDKSTFPAKKCRAFFENMLCKINGIVVNICIS